MGVNSLKTKTNDKLIRKELMRELLADNETVGVIEEYGVARGKARVDIVQIKRGVINAYEIKSDVDTLLRLPSQIRYYNQVFSNVTLVVGLDHVVEALYLIPDWWGVVVAQMKEEVLLLNKIRDAKQNNCINYRSVSDLFHKSELVQILKIYKSDENYWGMSKNKLIDEIHKEIKEDVFINELSGVLLNRSCYGFF